MSGSSSSKEAPLLSERHGFALTLTFNRPDRLNAVSSGMYHDLIEALESVEIGGDLRVVVLRGSGRAFCVGADLKAHEEGQSPEQRREYVDLGQRACLAIQQCPVPVVAVVHGYALGAGAEMAMSADFVIAAEDAQLGFPELQLGTFFGGGITSEMVRLLGLARARGLLFLGERFTGEQAAEWGLILRSVSQAGIEEAVGSLVGRLSALAPVSVAHAKRVLANSHRLPMDEVMRIEAETLLECMETDDWTEGIRAFAEKRVPRFEGR